MLLLSPPQCSFLLRDPTCKQTNFTSPPFSLPLWPARPATSLVALHSLHETILSQSTPKAQSASRKSPPSAALKSLPFSTTNMSAPCDIYHGSPRSPFSPTLGSIQEVFEYEPLDITSLPTTPLETQDASICVLLEPATTATPTVSLGPKTKGIISSPRKGRAALASSKVANVLRNVLEADRLRRRRVLRIYLKAIVFLKLLLKSHERYGALMATSGVYMQR
jgi:hypothetical protein